MTLTLSLTLTLALTLTLTLNGALTLTLTHTQERVVSANQRHERLRAAIEPLTGLRLVHCLAPGDVERGSRSALHKIRLAFDLEQAGHSVRTAS